MPVKIQDKKGVYWCNAHQREATHEDVYGKKCCDPSLGGILLPCSVIFLEDVEIIKENENASN